MSYNYGPPPPPPQPAPPSSSPTGYNSYGAMRGGHGGRGRGGHGNGDRGGFHQPAPAYGYGQPQYGPQAPGPYAGPHPAQPGYPQQPQQQWHPEHGQQQQHAQHSSSQPPHGSLPAQNYHPNYAPQIYQPQAPYGSQPQYPHAGPPPYGPGYPTGAPHQGPPAQQWGSHPQQTPPTSGPYGGGGRGGRGGYNNDRGGPKGQMMGPPIRIGFDNSNSQPPPAPVSAPYPPQPYGGPHGPPAPYAAPYSAYPPPAPYMPGPAPFDGHTGHNPRHHNRGGGFHSNSKNRSHFGGDKHRNRNQNKGQASQTPPTHHQKPDAASASKKKKRKTNTLGLTPGDESEEDLENEEERLTELIGAEAPNPQTSAELAAWIAERRAKFPTKAKIEAAKKATGKTQNGDASKDSESDLVQKAEKLRKQLKKVESSIKRKREQQDEGDEMRDLHLSSSPSTDSKSDDEKPEVMSTRQDSNNLPPPPRKADPTKHCKYYSTGGNCGKRGKCRFVHDATVREAALREREMNGGRMTLQQRLTLNDKEQEDLTIVKTVKYLQDKGLVPKPASGSAAAAAQPESSTAPQPQPPTVAKKEPGNGLPPIPPVPKYAGWNMNGFGNTGGRSSEQ
ncbi:uncharacterized protein QC761_116830 [Podospora bellae-mahoneyi]|uniref:C3H1-type domain-containing protein n=1 Tax=Podospora bellae-mahoneyi TaxID=2093777 RepID=A0ABR0G0H9_9PEZI|nr:hypothetical protein QC761_116830 [Podospora bellae-mahoneyi]